MGADNYFSVVVVEQLSDRLLMGGPPPPARKSFASARDVRPQPTPKAAPEQFGLVCLERVEVVKLNLYEFQVVVRTMSSPKPLALQFRSDTWRGLHVWVNGLALLSKLARSGFLTEAAP